MGCCVCKIGETQREGIVWVFCVCWNGALHAIADCQNRSTVVRLSFFKNPNFLCSLSLSMLVVIHRLLYRFLSQLRSNLLLPNAQARRFRQRHPKVSNVFTSALSPSIGSSLAGLALLLHPASDQRVTVAVYTFVKALEYSYNKLEDDGWFPNRPWVYIPNGMTLDTRGHLLTGQPAVVWLLASFPNHLRTALLCVRV